MRKVYTPLQGVMLTLFLLFCISESTFANKNLTSKMMLSFAASDISITASGPTSICQGESVDLSVDNGYVSYLWSTGDTTSVINVNSAGSFFVQVLDSLSNTLFSDTVIVTVGSPATANAGSDVIVCGTNELGLNGSIGGSASSGIWLGGTTASFLDGRTDLTGGYLADASEYGTILTLVLMTNDPGNGCPAGTDTLNITVLNVPDLQPIPNQSNTCPFTVFNLASINVIDANNTTGIFAYQDAFNNPLSSSVVTTSGTYFIVKATLTTPTCFDLEPVVVTIGTCVCDLVLTKTFVDATCPGSSDGSIDLTVTGGTPPYSYIWTTGDTIQDLSNISAGLYSVVVTDVAACMDTANATIGEQSALSVSCILNNHVTCSGGSDGFVSAAPAGAISPITYEWKDSGGNTVGTNLPILTGIPADTYTLIVTDGAGCVDSCSVTVTEPLFNCSIQGVNPLCNGGNDGSATATVTGGTSAFTYLWSNGQSVASISGLTAGTYTVTITDAVQCTSTCSVTLIEPADLTVQCIVGVNGNISCNGGNDGAISSINQGGTIPYTYQWKDSNGSPIGFNLPIISGLTAGAYTLVVTDANGCKDSCTTTLTEPSEIIVSISAATCNPQLVGIDTTLLTSQNSCDSLVITTTTLSPSNTINLTAATCDPLLVGIDTVFLFNQFGCDSLIITTTTLSPNNTLNLTAATCDPLLVGIDTVFLFNQFGCDSLIITTTTLSPSNTINLTAATCDPLLVGIDTVFLFNQFGCDSLIITTTTLSPSNTINLTATTCDALQVGIDTVALFNQFGCDSLVITTTALDTNCISNLVCVATSTNVSCNGGNDGTASVTANGGFTPYSYAWSSGESSASASNLSAGIHTVTVTDSLGSITSCTTNITEPIILNVDCSVIKNVTCAGGTDGEIGFVISGGTPPYAVNISCCGGAPISGFIAGGLTADTYTVIVTDSLGCVDTCMVTITEPDSLIATCIITQNISCNGANDGAASVSVVGGIAPYSYSWSNGATTSSITGLAAQIYEVFVTDSVGCIDSCEITLTEPLPLSPVTAGSNNPLCSNSLLLLAASGTYSAYLWSGPNGYGSTDQNPSFIVDTSGNGNYIVQASDSTGCSVSDSVLVTVINCYSLGDQVWADLNQDGLFNGSDTALSGITVTLHDSTGAIIGTIVTDSSGNYLFTNLVPGSYYVTFESIAGFSFTNYNAAGSQVNGTNGPGTTSDIIITSSDILTVDAGYISGISVGDYVWLDLNGNGLPDDGATGLQGIGVTLLDSADNVIAFTFTDSSGNYLFTNVPQGTYYVIFGAVPGSPATIPGLSFTSFNPLGSQVTGANGPGSTNLFAVSISSVLTIDAGYIGTGIVGDYVWNDLNGNGLQDDGLTGISGVVVQLTWYGPDSILGTIDDVVYMDTTDANGNYLFTNIPFGGVDVLVLDGTGTPLDGFFSTTGGSNQMAVLNISNPIDTLVDFGYIFNTCVSPVLTLVPTHIICGGDASGSIDLAVGSSAPPYSFIWSNNATTEDIGSLVAGTYTVMVTDNAGCTNSASISIIENPPFVIGKQVTNVSCNGSSDGVAVVTVNGAVPPYTYLWNTTPAQTNFIATGLSAGPVTVTIIDNAGCDTTTTITITQPPAIDASVSVTNVSCNGANDGSVTVNPIGGTPYLNGAPYNYAWNTIPVQTTQTATGLSGGFYTVVISDSIWCTKTVVVSVNEPDVLMVSINAFNITCNGGSNGNGTAIPSGGTPPFTYLWSDNQTNQAATNLTAGNYTVTVTDANNCTAQATFTLTQPLALSVNALVDDVSCGGANDGKISLGVSGGTAPYNFLWNTSPVLTTSLISGLAAGSYSVVITDANGCQYFNTYIISDPNPLNPIIVVTDVSCNNGNDGGILITQFTGGVSPYNILWSNGNSTMNNTGLTADTYYLTVTDSLGCVHFDSVLVGEPAELLCNTIVNGATCHSSSTGSILTAVTGGTAPYTYSWSDGTSASSLLNLGVGTYTLVVTDSLGCTKTEIYVINEPSILTLSNSVTNVSCNGGSNGSVTANPGGGTPPYTYNWSTGQHTQTITGLSVGVYTLNVIDANGCIKVSNVTITEPPLLVVSCTPINPNCSGTSTGTITASVSGGSPGYSYSWNSVPVQTNQTAINLPPGTYTVTVTDQNNCTSTSSCSVSQGGQLICSTTSTNVTCHGGSNGTATANATGGTAPYNFTWLTSPVQNTQTILGLAAGTYQVIVGDAIGCSDTCSVIITDPPLLSAIYTAVNPLCNGGTDGSIDIAVAGGTPPYSYLWNNGATTEDLSGIGAGLYSLTISDNNNCQYTAIILIIEPQVLACTITTTNASCSLASDGSAVATVSGGNAPYFFLWSDGSTFNSIINIPAGNYQLTVTDINGCTSTCIATVLSAPAITCNLSLLNGITCHGDSTGVIQANIIGGNAPFTISWNTSPVQTTTIATGLTAGTYTATINDASGCSTTCSIVLTEPAELTCSTTCTHVSCNGGSDGTAFVTAAGGVGPYTYSWNTSPVQTTQLATGLSVGFYTAVVTDANGCSTTCTIEIVQPPAILVNLNTTNITCNGLNNGSATVTILGGTPPYDYLWSNGATIATASGLSVGQHFLTVTDAHNCAINVLVMITEPSPLGCSIINIPVTCNGGNDGSATVSATGGMQPFTYLWSTSPAQTGITAVGLSAGTYTVTVTDASGCSTSCSTTVIEPSPLFFVPNVNDASCFGSSDGSIILSNISGGIAPYSFIWNSSPVQTTSFLTNVPHGTYTVIMSDANGCTLEKQATIFEPSEIVCTINSTPANCGVNNGTTTVSAVGGSGPYTYLWNSIPAQTNDTAVGLSPGSYTVIITDSKQCTKSCTVIVNGTNAITCTTNTIDASCFGSSDGSITITNISGGTTPYMFSWNTIPIQTTASITGLSAGTYTVVITSAGGCSGVKSIVVQQPNPVLEPVVNSNSPVCVGDVIMLTSSAGYSTYNWSGPNGFNSNQANPIFTSSALANGLYTLVVSDANNCTASSSVFVSVTSCVSVGDFTWIDLNGNGLFDVGEPPVNGVLVTLHDSTGAIVATTVTDSTGMYLFTNVLPGDYYVTFGSVPGFTFTGYNPLGSQVTGSNGPGTTNIFSVGSTDVLTIDAGYLGTGTIGDFVWEDLNNNGLQDDGPTGIPGVVVLLTWLGPDSILGTSDDVIYTDTTDSNGAYLFTNLPLGDYQVMVIDGSGTVLTGLTNTTGGNTTTTSLTVAIPTDLNQDFGYVDSVNVGDFTWIDVNGNGLFDVGETPIGGVLVMLHDSSGTVIGTTITDSTGAYLFTNVFPGDYYVTFGPVPGYVHTNFNALGSQVTGTNGTGTTSIFTVDSTDVLTIDAGYLGTGTIGDFVWEDLNNNGLQDDGTTGIPGVVVQLTWLGPDGILGTSDDVIYTDTTDVNGGYLFTNLPLGDYQVMVNDGSGTVLTGFTNTTGGNTSTTSITVANPTDLTQDFGYNQGCVQATISVLPTNVLCFGDSTGSAILTVSAGSSPFTYLWSNGATSQNLNNVPSGIYTVTVTSSGGCSVATSVFIGENPPLSCVIADSICTIDFDLSQLQGGEIVTEQFSNLGIHISGSGNIGLPDAVIVYDSNDSTQVNDPDLQVGLGNLLILPTDIIDANNDSLVDNPDDSQYGGTITFLFDNPVEINSMIFVDQDDSNLPIVNAYDSLNNLIATATVPQLGDMSVQTLFLNAPNTSKLEIIAFGSVAVGPISIECASGTHSATVNPTGGIGPYTYSWNTSPVQTTQTINGIDPGTYVAEVTDFYGCTTSCDIVIGGNPCPKIAINAQTYIGGRNNSCNQIGDGYLFAVIDEGTAPFSFMWSTGHTTTNLSSLGAGTYTLTVSDGAGCQSIKTIILTEPDPIACTVNTVNNVGCNGGTDGSLSIAISGGNAPYISFWNTSPVINGLNLNNVPAGSYTLSVVDTNGCVDITTYQVTEPLELKVWSKKVNVQCNKGSDGSIDLKVIRGTAPYSYLWNDGTTTEDRNNLPRGYYTVTVTDANGCSDVHTKYIAHPKRIKHVTIINHVTCFNGNDGSIDLIITGGSAPYTYLWQDGTTTQNRANLTKGWYRVTVTDIKGCTYYRGFRVNHPKFLKVLVTTQDVSTSGGSDGSATELVSGGVAPYSFLWSTGSTASSISGLIAGTYQLTATDANGCSRIKTFTIVEPIGSAPLTCNAIGSNTTCGSSSGTATVTATGGFPPYTYYWNTNPGQTTATATNLASGTYLIQVSDSRGTSSSIFCFATITCTNAKTGAPQIDEKSLLGVYPNPFTNEINLNILSVFDNEKFDVQVIDMLGKSVYQITINTVRGMSTHQMTLANLPEGIYFVKLKSNHSSFVERLIKH